MSWCARDSNQRLLAGGYLGLHYIRASRIQRIHLMGEQRKGVMPNFGAGMIRYSAKTWEVEDGQPEQRPGEDVEVYADLWSGDPGAGRSM